MALCLHGWYETIGGYSYDDAKKEIKPEWVAMGRTRKVPFTQDEVRRQLKLARDLGFRVLLYFGDGAAAGQRRAALSARVGLGGPSRASKISGWTGPDTWGQTFARNPAHPQVVPVVSGLLAALLKAFGPVVDGFVWDETFYIRAGDDRPRAAAGLLRPGDVRLVKTLTAQVRAADRRRCFSPRTALALVAGRHERPRLRHGRRRHLSGHRLRAGGLVLRAVSQLAERAVELQLVFAVRIPLHPLGRGALRRAGGDLQRLGRRPRAVGVDAGGPREDSHAVPPTFDPRRRVRYLTVDPATLGRRRGYSLLSPRTVRPPSLTARCGRNGNRLPQRLRAARQRLSAGPAVRDGAKVVSCAGKEQRP